MDILDQILAAEMAKQYSDSKGGYTKTTKTVILPETTVTPDQHRTDMGVNGYFPLGGAIPFTTGKRYKVVVDGDIKYLDTTEYDPDVDQIYCVGNPAIYDNSGFYPDNGEPWVLLSYETMGMSAVGFADPTENEKSHTVAVYELVKTIVPFDPKFLPGVCLPVVELSTTVERGATFTDAENAALNEAFNTKLPFVVRANLSVESVPVNDAVSISQNGVYDGIKMFALTFGSSIFQIMEQNGVWVVA